MSKINPQSTFMYGSNSLILTGPLDAADQKRDPTDFPRRLIGTGSRHPCESRNRAEVNRICTFVNHFDRHNFDITVFP